LQRNILPWALLATAVVVAFTVFRSPASPGPAPATSALPPAASEGLPGVVVSGGPAPSGPVYDDPPMTDDELRDSRIKVGHEMCEEGAKRINELQGLSPTDKQGIKFIGACLQRGNAAWYKCLVQATTRVEAGTCNRRFLTGLKPR
jgi:hypothetical protein